MTTAGLGFAGVGWLGECLIKDLAAVPELSLSAVQDVVAERAEEVARQYGAAWHGNDFEALLRAPGVDAVVICTPNALHAPQARAALWAGKHVLVQKPIALTRAEAEETITLAREIGCIVFPDYTYRYLATVDALAGALAEVGPARSIRAAFHNIYGPGKGWFFEPELSGGGALVDLGVHLLDLALALLGPAEVRLERAELSFARGLRVEDGAAIDLRLDDAPMQLEVSWNAPLPLTEIFFEVEGERGTARWENVEGSFFHFRTLHDGICLIDRETTLRLDTLRAFARALAVGEGPRIETRVYDLLAQTYAATPWGVQAGRRD